MPTINGKRVLANSPEALSQTNALGGINKVSNKEASGSVTPGTTGTGVSQIQPSISANELINPPTKVNPPVPTLNTNTGANTANLVNNVATNNQQFIASQSAEALKAKELANLLGTQTFDAAGQRTQLNEQYGLPANLSRLTDIQTQLTKANTASDVQKTQIEGAAGQTMGQAQREVTQQDRENAVRTAGLAAEAAVLQGSIETASTLVNQAMTDYYSDRQLKNQNMIQQLNYFSGIADEQTKQLLEKETRKYAEDQAKVKRVLDTVDAAMTSGAATPEDMRTLTNPKATDEERLAVAQDVVSRGAAEMRDLTMEAQKANIAQSWQSVAANKISAKLDQAQLDSYNKAQEDAANGILTGEQVGVAQTINKDFEDEPIVKEYNTALAKSMVIEDTLANGIDGIQDLQLVYEFMKAVDPTSVVRESEFATAANTGNIFQGAYARFNKAFGTGGFLPEEVKNDFIRAARASFDAKNTQYYNIKAEKANQINQRLGINNGADYLTAYESAAPLQQVDFNLADTFANATEQDMFDVMQMTNELLANPSGQSGR